MTDTDRSYWQVLRDRRLALLLGGDMVSKVGDGMILVALPLQTLRGYHGPNPGVAIAVIEAAPYALAVAASLVFGLTRYRFRPRGLLATDCVLRFSVFTVLAVLALRNTLPLWVLGIALFAGSGLRLLAASSRRLVATGMTDEAGRFAVNGLLGSSGTLAATVAGPVLGGVLATAFSPGLVLLLDGVSFLALLLVVLTVVPAEPATPANPTASAEPVSSARPAVSGVAILRRVPVAAWLLVVTFFFDLFYMPNEVALPLLVRDQLHGSGAALGEIWTSFGIGALIGSVATNHMRRLPRAPLLTAIIAGWGGCVLLLAAAPNVAVAAIAFAVGGLIYAPFTPVAYSMVQDALRPEEQQPVLTLLDAALTTAAPIGLVLGGPLVGFAGPRGSLVTSAALTLLLVPLAVRSRQRVAVATMG